MLKPFNSPSDAHNGHLRNLIDLRNARSDPHGRLSAAVSDFSDTPSVYSHSNFSPHPSEIGQSRAGYAYSSSISDVGMERYEPQGSILDITDHRPTSYDYDNANYSSPEEVTGQGEIARMSRLGPKMRVHSRAPWEEEVDEENYPESLSFSRKHAVKCITSAFSSPRPSLAGGMVSRQSEDSSTKRSFDTVNSQVSASRTRGGLYALSQESSSSNSLARRTPAKESLLSKSSLGRLRSETSTVINIPPVPSLVSSPANNRIPTDVDRESSPSRSASSASSNQDSIEFLSARKASTHPYANPALVVSYPEEVQDTSAPSDTHYLPYSDSRITVMEPVATYNAQATASMPDAPVNTVAPKARPSPIKTKTISSPVTVINSLKSLSPGGVERSLPGWTERSAVAPFTLISLEEARAKRDRAAPTSSSSAFGTPFSGSDTNYSTSSSSQSGSRARGRSTSTGANAKTPLLWLPKSESQGSEPIIKDDFIADSPRTLRNKKSGFMRIFNRDKELNIVPPVPSIPDGISQPYPSGRLPVVDIHRLPVPPLSPLSHPEVSISQNGAPWQADMLVPNKSLKRSLSINTTTQGSSAHTSRLLDVPSPITHSAPAAPAHLLESPVLKLRPVSMLFSESFGDLVPAETPGQESARPDYPAWYKSPLTTPMSPSRPPYDVSSDVNHPAVKALQEHMLSSKIAWERQILELEGQVRDLKAELEQMKDNDEYCDKCGRGERPQQQQHSAGIINRPRARTGTSYRFVNAAI